MRSDLRAIRRSTKQLLICSLLWTAVSACDDISDPQPDQDAFIRLENLSPYTLREIRVAPGEGGERTYMELAPGQITEYQSFDFVYRVASITAIIGQDTLGLHPLDYSQEEVFDGGFFTYLIDITTIENRPGFMILDFRED
jgi:hypothetical protein